MSTKTTFKRVALVAVASMGFGMLSVVSANAAALTQVLTLGTATPTIPVVGTAVRIPVLAEVTVVSDGVDTCTYTPTVNSVPNNSAIVTGAASTSFTADITGLVATLATTGFVTFTASTNALLATSAVGGGVTGPSLAGGFSFTPDVPGEYSITIAAAAVGGSTCTVSALAAIIINVGGVSATQAFSGLGSTSATQIGGRLVSANFVVPATTAAATLYQVTSTAGLGISSAAYGTANLAASISNHTTTTNIVKTDGSTFASGFSWTTPTLTTNNVLTAAKVTGQLSVQMLAPATAGTYYLYFKSVNPTTGVLTTAATQTVVVTSSANTAVSAAKSTMVLQSAACPTWGSSKLTDTNAVNTLDAVTDSASAAGGVVYVCIKTRDGNEAALAPATSSVLTSTLGTVGGFAFDGTATSESATITGVATMTGKATVTAVIIDAAGNAITMSATLDFYGALATLTLAPQAYSAQPYADGWGTAATAADSLLLTAKDASGVVIDLATAGNSTGVFTVDSSGTAGAPADRDSDSLGATASANNGATYGDYVGVSCLLSSAPEKLTITAWGKDVLGNWVKSNSVDYYCSSSTVASLVVTPASSSVDKAKTTTLDIVAKDASGFMVPDGTAVAWAATSGTVIAASTTTRNGSLLYDAVYTSADANGVATVTAVAGTKGFSGTTSITVGSGDSDSATNAAADAAAEATDAANAATDAANAAAEAADAATAAAQDASDAVAALSVMVAEMIASLKAQLTALTNLVIKIQKKVKA